MKKILVIVIAVILTLTLSLPSVTFAAETKSKTLTMDYYSNSEENCCGPKSGVSIGWYYKTQVDRDGNGIKDYSGLPSKYDMFWDLHDYMETNFGGGTGPQKYANGFLEMTIKEGGYDNFSYVYDDDVTDGDWWKIKDAIDNGWPVALEGGFTNVPCISKSGTENWPPRFGHYIAIKGYSYQTDGSLIWDRRIDCTDNCSKSDDIWFSWDRMVSKGIGLYTITIKDEREETVIEDFEWGNAGTSLENWEDYGGKVEWTVSTRGSSVVEIDIAQKHSGTRSGRLYCDGSSNIRASYQQCNPTYIRFWLMKDDNSFPTTITSNGVHQIRVRVNGSEMLQYGRSSFMYNVCPISANEWHLIEFKNIDWYDDFTYDIYVDGFCKKSNVRMDNSIYNTGTTVFYAPANTYGSFWIDDILK